MKIPCLASPRLALRPYHQVDFDAFVSLNADGNVRRYVGGPLSHENATRLFARFVAGNCIPGNEVWAVVDKEAGDYVGHCWFVRQGTDPPEMGFLIAPMYWGRGYGTEIAATLLNYARNEASYDRIIATVDTDNLASICVLEQVGMKREKEEQDDEGVHYVYGTGAP